MKSAFCFNFIEYIEKKYLFTGLFIPGVTHIPSPVRAYYKRQYKEKLEEIVMEQTIHLSRGGWTQEENDLLWKEIQAAADSGAPLRGVFEKTGQALGRKPNSVRNYYYMHIKDQSGRELRRASPFEAFTPEEIHGLLRHVLIFRGQGRSVRAAVMDLSGGDRARMLRYQNKYRSILRKKPSMIMDVMEELQKEGQPCPASVPALKSKAALSASPLPEPVSDPDAQAILTALSSLLRRAEESGPVRGDRLKVQRDLLSMRLEDLQLAVKALLAVCKDFLGTPPDQRSQNLIGFCSALSRHVASLESLTE